MTYCLIFSILHATCRRHQNNKNKKMNNGSYSEINFARSDNKVTILKLEATCVKQFMTVVIHLAVFINNRFISN